MKIRNILFFVFFIGFCFKAKAQNNFDNFFKPSDSLNKQRLNTVIVSEAIVGSATLIALNQTWYADYPRSKFHFINDNAEWLQMDKAGHVFSSYHLGAVGANSFKWAGANKKTQLVYGATLGFTFLTAVEVLDGFSANWGASLGDVAANAGGTALFVSQELLWNEQRIVPKFSFQSTPYASRRPNVLGSSFSEQILKDYNGQTYWLSANIHSFFKKSKFPKLVNIAIGYGAEGMITGKDEFVNTIFLPLNQRERQFYLSLDLDLTKIQTKSHFIKTVLTVLNTVKIPAPTFEIRDSGKTRFHLLYF